MGKQARAPLRNTVTSGDPSPTWQHVKFDSPMDTPISTALPDRQITGSPQTDRELERGRDERMENSRNGQFVGFRGPSSTGNSLVRFMGEKRPPTTENSLPRSVGRFGPSVVHRSVMFNEDGTLKPREEARGIPRGITRVYNQDRPSRTSSTSYVEGPSRHSQRKRSKFISEYENESDDMEDKIERKRRRAREKAARKLEAPPTPIILPEYISVTNLATALRVPVEKFAKKMRELGFEEISQDHILDAETAGLVASEFNFEPTVAPKAKYQIQARPPAENPSALPPRPPVVTIMGHVDHGKTTLLDWLRKSSVAASEHGGITQHIGAFSVSMPSGRLITFLDTPGHAAFLDMRQRGANVTDIVILVVAADDSVKPQTLEALKHAQAAKVPIIVAVNKVDKPDADVDRVKKDLARHGMEIEEHGGDTQVVPVSGKTGRGMAELEDAVIALADLLDMRAETDGAVEGWVLEATTKKSGRVATVLVSRGTIKAGDLVVAGSTWAKVRTLRNESGALISAAGPGTPVEVDGWREQPSAGDQVLQTETEQQAKGVIDQRLETAQRDQMATDMAAVNESRKLAEQKLEEEKQRQKEEKEASAKSEAATPAKFQPGITDVYFIVKADVSGSVEAVVNSISAIGNSEVRPQIFRSGVGAVTESDIEHIAIAKGHIITFNTVTESNMILMAERAGVQIYDHSIIYRLVDDVKRKLSEYLAPLITYRVLGEAEIAQIFEISIKPKGTMTIAGSKVRNGVITRKGKVRVMRNGEIIHNGLFFLVPFSHLLPPPPFFFPSSNFTLPLPFLFSPLILSIFFKF